MALKTKKPSLKQKMMTFAKIEKLPKDISSSLPFRGITPTGIIETYPGTFTKQYHLDDINFQMAPLDEQVTIFSNFEALVNSFSDTTKWEFTIFNHKVDKRETLKQIQFTPQNDGLNHYRQEMTGVLVDKLCEGNNSIAQDKFLTVSIKDENLDHAAETLRRVDKQVATGIKKITGHEVRPMRPMERLELLYNIYNQDYDYRFPIVEEYKKRDGEKGAISLKDIEKQGISIRDVVGPPVFDYSPRDHFKLGNTYGRTMYLANVPASLTSDFIAEISDTQCNMLVSTTAESYNMEDATKLVKNRIADLEGEKNQRSRSYAEAGYIGSSVSPELQQAVDGANEMLKDITKRNQKIIFMTMTITVFAETKELLDEFTKNIEQIATRQLCSIKTIHGQQEFAFNTSLPLCRDDLYVDRMYTSETVSVFLPYKSIELNQKNSIFYGLNDNTKNMILYDRTSGPNYNGLIFGFSGSGKSFTAKLEMISVLLNHPDAQLFVIDPQGEYCDFCIAFGGSHIELMTGGTHFLNPLDLDLTSDKESGNDPIATKSDFVMSMLDFMATGHPINPAARSIVDRCVRRIYRPYVKAIQEREDGVTCDPSICPTLSDLYSELRLQNNELADEVNAYLESYAIGSFKTFARRTNIETNSKFVVYDMKKLSSGMRPLGLHICINDVWNRMMENSRYNIYTWFYIDEFHLLLSTESSAKFMKQIWKMARKWKGVPTGITQNTEEILNSEEARAIFLNTSFIIILFEQMMDRQNLQTLLNLSDSQLEIISEPNPGHGLLYNGRFIINFEYEFPENTDIFRLIQTKNIGEQL